MKLKIYLLLFAVSTAGIFSCVKEKDPVPDPGPPAKVHPNQFTINGDGFTNSMIALDIDTAHEAFYVKPNTTTYISMKGENDSLFIFADIEFTGNQVKNKTFDPANIVSISTINKTTGYGRDYTGQSGLLKVTSYGPVGQKIEGTYSGTFSNSGTGVEVEITNGKFSVIRSADQQ